MNPYKISRIILIGILFLIAISFLCQSCRAYKDNICKHCTLNQTVKDSVGEPKTTQTPFDTALFLSGIKGKDIQVNNCDSLFKELNKKGGKIETKENGIKQTIEKSKSGTGFVFKCEADSLKAVIKLLKTKIENYNFKTITKEVPARCERRHITDREIFFLFVGKIALIIIGLYILFLAIKPGGWLRLLVGKF